MGQWRIGDAGVGSGVPVGAYSARLGVRADPYGVFLVRIARDLGDDLVLIENLPRLGKTKLRTVQAAIEKQVLYPTVAGRHVDRWQVRDSGIYLLFVQDPAAQRGVAEDFLKRERGRTFDYLSGFRSELLAVGSAVVRELREKGPFYSMYSVTEETLAPYKVAWPRMTNHMQACVISSVFDGSLGKRLLLPTETVAFIPLDSEREAHYLCALLNSSVVGGDLSSFSAAGRGFASPSVLRHLPLPKYEATDLQESLADLSIEAHVKPASFGTTRQQQLDALVAECFAAYGVSEPAGGSDGAEHAPEGRLDRSSLAPH